MTLLVLAGLPADAQLSLPPDYARRQLSPTGEAASSVTLQLLVDPRGEWVVFVGDVELAGAEAVYSMRRNGGDLHRLSAYGAAGSVGAIALSPDGRRVIYRGDLETDGLGEIWSVALPGPAASAVKLSHPVTGAGVLGVFVPEQGDRLAYFVDGPAHRELWSVPVTGPAAAAVHLDPPFGADEEAAFAFATPDGHGLLFLQDIVTGAGRIWSVPLAGPAGAGLFLLDPSPADCLPFPSTVTPGSNRLIYLLFCDTTVGVRANQLWSVPVAGPAAAAVSLAGSFAEGGEIGSLLSSPDGARLVFIADKLADDRFELWSVPAAGPAGALVRLNDTLVAGGDVVVGTRISPDSLRVAYIADQEFNERFSAWSVPIVGPSTHALPLVTGSFVGRDVTALEFTADSSTVVLRADLTVDNRFDLYQVPANASAAQEQITNDSFPPGSTHSIGSLWRLHPDGRRVVYTFDEDAVNDQRGLGEQRLAPNYVQDARLNGAPVAGGSVIAFEVYPDSRGTLYRSDELFDNRFHLFTVDSRIFGDGFEEGSVAAWADAP